MHGATINVIVKLLGSEICVFVGRLQYKTSNVLMW